VKLFKKKGIQIIRASYNATMTDNAELPNSFDPYANELYSGYTEAEIVQMQTLMADWTQATYPTLATSIVKHAKKHGFTGEYLRYLRKASNFNKKGSRQKRLPDGAIRWNKGSEFLIERDGKIVTYGENA
jgi:hypothetical protein